ncbi:uncharacterized protein LOC110440689, partial [Mizuhopecten yessoensis]|uniref:uncharacterized protein LOC110440689 n=1 Tax=Mizuhopecten yessoensis TaxID=6573 RepID=UPI000B45B453
MSTAFRHNSSPENLISHLEISYQPNKKLELDVTGSFGNSANGQVTIKTPFVGYEETTGAFTQTLRSNGYEAHLEAVYNQVQRLEIDLSVSPSEGRFVIRTPFAGFAEISTAYNNVLASDSITGHVEAAFRGQKMEVDVSLSNSNGKITIKTPLSGYEEMSAAFTQQLTNSRFTGKLEI